MALPCPMESPLASGMLGIMRGNGVPRVAPPGARCARPRVSFLTLGCRVNQYETDAMRAQLGATCDIVDEGADVYIVNGCSVTSLAEKKARQAVRRLRLSAPSALFLLTGCLADAVLQGKSSFEAMDLVAASPWKVRMAEVVAAALAGRRGSLDAEAAAPLDLESSAGPADRVRAYLKVQDGCSGACSYCRAVQLRGPSRSKSLAAAAAEAERLVGLGYPELVVTGINLAEYAAGDARLPDLLARLLAVPGLVRLRIASLNVTGITDALLDVFAADPRLCPHFHIPLQSGDDGVLRAMHRLYSARDYRQAVARVRGRLPDATFGSDVIVGFPGEDERAFARTCEAVEAVGFSNLHVFRFSPRRGTEAAELPGAVPESTKRDRALALTRLGDEQRARILDDRVGSAEDVLVEGQLGGRFHGHSAGYLRVEFTSRRRLPEGALCRVRVLRAARDGLEGVHDDQHGAD